MKNLILALFMSLSLVLSAQKAKNFKLKYTLPAGWSAEEFGGKSPWEDEGNALCHCSGIHFFKMHKDGKMNVVVYPSTQAGLDSAKRNFVGPLYFEDVTKKENVRSNERSFERKKSTFTDSKSKRESFGVFRYFTKVDDHYYIIYAWQENPQPLNSTDEKDLLEMVRNIEVN